MQAQRLLPVCLILAACSPAQSVATTPVAPPATEFHGAVAGICSKLDVARIGDRTLILYGDTGYQMTDWNPGETLAAAQSFVEVRGSQVVRNLSLLEGLPSNAGGFVSGDLSLGGRSLDEAWLLRTTSRYSKGGAGALFEHDLDPFTWNGRTWEPYPSSDYVQLPAKARSLPELPVDALCPRRDPKAPDLRFVRVTSTVHEATGHLWVAGRCQSDSHVNYRPTRIVIAHGAPGSKEWEISDAPASSQLDAIVNLSLFARSPNDLYLVAYEPFLPLERRVPYLAHFDGTNWRVQHPPMTTGITSVSGSDDGTLWAAAGRDLWRQDADGTWKTIPLPPLPFVARPRTESVRVSTVRAFGPDDVWVGVVFMARVKQGERNEAAEVRGAALYHSRPLETPLYCDAREPIETALVAVEESR